MTTPRSHLIRAAINADQQTHEEAPAEYRPEVPKRVRDGVYWATLGVAAAAMLVSGVTGIWFPEIAPEVLATTGVATGVMGIIGGGVGVVYRPGADHRG